MYTRSEATFFFRPVERKSTIQRRTYRCLQQVLETCGDRSQNLGSEVNRDGGALLRRGSLAFRTTRQEAQWSFFHV
jgi:hypothetical protein